MDAEILKELEKNKIDKSQSEKELEIDKMRFIEEMKKYDFSFDTKPLIKKLPLSIRVGRFINKLLKVFSND